MTFKKTLQEVINILKQGHCTGEYAKDKNGISVNATDPDACQWCLSGAIIKVSLTKPESETDFRDKLWLKLAKSLEGRSYPAWNDAHPEEVIPTLENLYNSLED